MKMKVLARVREKDLATEIKWVKGKVKMVLE